MEAEIGGSTSKPRKVTITRDWERLGMESPFGSPKGSERVDILSLDFWTPKL